MKRSCLLLLNASASIIFACVLLLSSVWASSSLAVPPSHTAAKTSTFNSQDYAPHLRAKIAHSVAKGERRAQERDSQLRVVCSQCQRPHALCLCHVLPPAKIYTSTSILILQHPNERRKRNLSTVPLLRMVLKNIQVVVGYTFDVDNLPVVREVLKQGKTPLLLYPREDAIALDETSYSPTPSIKTDSISSNYNNKISTNNLLIIMDGTWTEAKRMVRDSPSLVAQCQAVQFTSDSTSIYDALRREPESHCLSTLEACAEVLSFLEADSTKVVSTVQSLHQVLQAHVDAHLKNAQVYAPRSVGSACQKLYEKNRRRREIELAMFAKNKQQRVNAPVQNGLFDRKPAGMLAKTKETPNPFKAKAFHQALPDGSLLRSLQLSDASLIDSWWEYRSPKSLPEIQRRIMLDDVGCCLGVEVEGELVASIMKYEGGALGMLYVLPKYRRRGYATLLLQYATKQLQDANRERVAFVIDGNDASERVFKAAGWERDCNNPKKQTGRRKSKRKWIQH